MNEDERWQNNRLTPKGYYDYAYGQHKKDRSNQFSPSVVNGEMDASIAQEEDGYND